MSNQPNNPGNTSEDSGAKRVSTTNHGQDGTSKNEAFAAAQKAQQEEQNQNNGGQNNATTSTQSNMGNGDGIRGEYGDASQTNGMEGGSNAGNKDENDTRQNHN
ncbi:hypothetical protein LGH70_12030 [Hymenobacter sp. BT635]|uniref:Stress protein n=1 Tax=Hymenobacter nitidus TaxID=2880929 RepID=A0ABS8AD42_9BACT|nr:hypothetical protein [Hymenobacter nitidus]MCB2378318.1 hypothetical protein [Hymenobacter nitidus]